MGLVQEGFLGALRARWPHQAKKGVSGPEARVDVRVRVSRQVHTRYAPNEVKVDEQKQEHFLEGLNDGIQYMLTAHTFENF